MNVYEASFLPELLKANDYPGRSIVIGMTEDGKKAAVAYFIMGRSNNSRNRVFIEEGENLSIHPFDASKVEDPSLIIYYPIRVYENKLIVTNGDQTDTIYNFLRDDGTFEQALETRKFEPDAPNYTPRISGMLTFADGSFTYKMSILKSADADACACNRFTFAYAPTPGIGHFIHTYNADGSPLPSFSGEPERVKIENDIDAFGKALWSSINEDNKVSLYVRYIDLATGDTENRLYNKNV